MKYNNEICNKIETKGENNIPLPKNILNKFISEITADSSS